MAVKQLTYAELGELWGVSRDAARKKVEGLRLPRQLGNDGKTRVTINLDEVSHTPKASKPEANGRPPGDLRESNPGDLPEGGGRPEPEVMALQTQIATLEARASELRADLDRERSERERERAELVQDRDRERNERLRERERADKFTGEVAELARELAQITSQAGARERELHDNIRAAESIVAKMKSASWWKRLRRA